MMSGEADAMVDAACSIFHDKELWAAECDADARRLVARFTAVHQQVESEGLTFDAAVEQARCELAHAFLRIMHGLAEVGPDGYDPDSPWANFD